MALVKTTFNLNDNCQNCWNTFLNDLTLKYPNFAMYLKSTQEFFFKEDTSEEYLANIQNWIDTFECQSAEDEIEKYLVDISPQTMVRPYNPTIYENLPNKNSFWINKKTGEFFINLDNTPNKNIWVALKTGRVIRPPLNADKFDIFGDGSCLVFYPFNNDALDMGGKYNGLVKNGEIDFQEEIRGYSACLKNNTYIEIPILPLPREFSVSYWFKNKRPIKDICSFHITMNGNNYLSAWSTKSALKAIINDETFIIRKIKKNEWNKPYHMVLQSNGEVFLNGNKVLSTGKIVNGDLIQLPPVIGADRDGAAVNDFFNGCIDEFRIFGRNLTEEEVQELYKAGTVLEVQ